MSWTENLYEIQLLKANNFYSAILQQVIVNLGTYSSQCIPYEMIDNT